MEARKPELILPGENWAYFLKAVLRNLAFFWCSVDNILQQSIACFLRREISRICMSFISLQLVFWYYELHSDELRFGLAGGQLQHFTNDLV